MQSLAISHAVQILSSFDGTFNEEETEQLTVPMSLDDYQLLEELLFGSPEQQLSMDSMYQGAMLLSFSSEALNHSSFYPRAPAPLVLVYNHIPLFCFSVYLRPTCNSVIYHSVYL